MSRSAISGGWVSAVCTGIVLVCALVRPAIAQGPEHAVEPASTDEEQFPYRYLRHLGAISASFDLGTDPGDDFKLRTRKRVFGPDDTIAVSVATQVAGDRNTPGLLEVVFTYDSDGEELLVSHQSRDMEFSAEGLTNVQIAKPDGFPEGTYAVEVRINAVVVGKTSFRVVR